MRSLERYAYDALVPVLDGMPANRQTHELAPAELQTRESGFAYYLLLGSA